MQDPIPALVPSGTGHQFVLYADACSGIPDEPNAGHLAAVNAVIRRLTPPPEFILFPGDEIVGLTPDTTELRTQWRHFLDHEMAWLDRTAIPLFHTTGNHTVYDPPSEAMFREVLDLPRNGPPEQEGLSYWVRRGDLLLVFVNTLWSGLGGEGHVETDWLRTTLHQHADARYKFVLGHHPAHPVNGFAGAYQRDLGWEYTAVFWDILVQAGVMAYLCSHILAFDVQVHRGVLQICSAGAGTARRMPEGIEYHHAVQAALDAQGLRYQVLDSQGAVRERLSWPPALPPEDQWRCLAGGEHPAPLTGEAEPDCIIALRLRGRTAGTGAGPAQTLVSAFTQGVQSPLWIGLRGPAQTLTVILGPEPRWSPGYWIGPPIPPGAPFDLHLLLHTGMGPGGILLRVGDDGAWSSLTAAAAWGAERLVWPERWSIGHAQHGPDDRSFLGSGLHVAAAIRRGRRDPRSGSFGGP
jgi:hypothetical protein